MDFFPLQRASRRWTVIDKLHELLQPEAVFVGICLCIAMWCVYKLFLKEISAERHRTLDGLFRSLAFHLITGSSLFAAIWLLEEFLAHQEAAMVLARVLVALAAVSWFIIIVKAFRVGVYLLLFLSNPRAPVPLLIVNLAASSFLLLLTALLLTEIFNFAVVPLLATSAVFSIVLGLAMQDTLGNLFAGISLQFDKPYGIGDWIEVQSGAQKFVGQVMEVSWRATLLLGFFDEYITIPNRVMAQSEISNYAGKDRPLIRSVILRIPHGASAEPVKRIFVDCALKTKGICSQPMPFGMVQETMPSWYNLKLVYFIEDYGSQYVIADRLNTSLLAALAEKGIQLAGDRLIVDRPLPS